MASILFFTEELKCQNICCPLKGVMQFVTGWWLYTPVCLLQDNQPYDEFFFFPLTPESVTITVYYHCGENVCSYSLQRTTTWFRILKWLFVKVSFNSSRIPSCEYQKLSRNSRGGNESQWPTTLTQAFISA